MLKVCDCEKVSESLCEYADGTLPGAERRALEQHLVSCPSCREGLKQFSAVKGLLDGAMDKNQKPLGQDFNDKTGQRMLAVSARPPKAKVVAELEEEEYAEPVAEAPAGLLGSLNDRFGAAPWWGISLVLHVLVIMLLGLITMAIHQPDSNDDLIVVTKLERAPAAKIEEVKAKPAEQRDILESVEKPATDPTSEEKLNIVIPPEILAKAEVGDHFETINLDRPDTHSAFGNPDARMFHDEHGNDEPEGGGGNGGTGISQGGGGTGMMDDVIGLGGNTGAGSVGTGGGWGGGNGTGTGIGNGAGHGSFGQRGGGGRRLMVMKGGGSKATESAVDAGLDWLARHQEADGHWVPSKFGGGQAEGTSEIGATGLALLAFLGAGHSEKIGRYKDNVQRAVKWFATNQAPSGQFSCPSDPHSSRMYGHGIATMAMSEAAAMGKNPETRKAAQKGVTFIAEAQNRSGGDGYQGDGWDYTPKGGTNDTSVTSWMVLALKSAKVAGLSIEPRCIEGGMAWLDAAQGGKGDDYKLGIWYRGTTAQVKPVQEKNPSMNFNNNAVGEHALLAAGAVMRLFLGAAGKGDNRINATGDYLLKRLPQWSPGGKTCLYHLYYGTLCMFQIGGGGWKQWNEALKNALVPNQVKGGDDNGSWDPSADWLGIYGGRVYTTAMSVLCLEIYYRYLPVYREK